MLVIKTLIDAADNGKQVTVTADLKARFDGQNNLEWARRLEENGHHVAYGTLGLKTHANTALVVRKEDDGVTMYSHVGTGNDHSETATQQADVGILTADRDIGTDLMTVFNFFSGPCLDDEFEKLLLAPVTMRTTFTELIRRETDHAAADRDGRIVAKMNGLEDPDIVAELYRASMAGVDIDLIVRDICRLRPGLEGVSENVTVHSVVGRVLEHSRILYFGNDDDPEWYLGSADWTTRSLDNRVETVVPVEDPDVRTQLRFLLESMLEDTRWRWVMQSDGTYEQVQPDDDEGVRDAQAILMEQTRRAARDDEDGRGVPTHDHPIEEEMDVELNYDAGLNV